MVFTKLITLIALLIITSTTFASFEKSSVKSYISFNGTIEISKEDYKKHNEKDLILKQVKLLYGILQSEYLAKKFNIKESSGVGVPGKRVKISNIKVLSKTKNRITLSYDYISDGIISKEFLLKTNFSAQIYLPKIIEKEKVYFNECKDDGTYGAYFYYFDLYKKECRDVLLKHNDLIKTEFSFEPYVEFDSKFNLKDRINSKEINTSIFLGYDEKFLTEKDIDNIKQDDSYKDYLNLINHFQKQGYEILKENNFFKLSNEKHKKGANNLAILSKQFNDFKHTIKIFALNVNIEDSDLTFILNWKEALENDNVIVYSGHSGLGKNISISKINSKLKKHGIKKIKKSKTNFQILFLNSCSSYGYYNDSYKENLEKKRSVITTGLPSYFTDNFNNITSFINSIFAENTSFYEIINNIELTNKTAGKTLVEIE